MPTSIIRRIVRDATRRAARPLRRAPLRLACSILVVIVTMAVMWSLLTRAEQGARRYGDVRSVVVATRDLDAGETIDDDSAELRELPADARPARAVTSLDGQRLVDPVHRGQVIVGGDVTVHRSQLAAALGPGRRAIGLAVDRIGLELHRGDIVDVWTADAAGAMTMVAAAAEVVGIGARVVTVAVGSSEVGDVAGAVAADIAVVTLRPG